MDKAIFILGPTGVGKSDIAIKLAQKFDGEIISSDSVQVFKGFDIGSAKIKPEEMGGIVHHGIDIAKPTDYFTVFDFVEFTKSKIKEINKKGKLPIVVGGTGLYIKALTEGYNFGEANKNQEFRDMLKERASKEGSQKLWEELEAQNHEMAEKISSNDEKRIIRALELCEFGVNQTKSKADFEYKIFALNMPREKLYERINKRVDIMVNEGLFEEVEGLLRQGLPKDCQPMKAIGYKEVVAFFEGEQDKERTIELVKQHSRNYSKRQLTFLRGMNDVKFVEAEDKNMAFDEISKDIEKFLL